MPAEGVLGRTESGADEAEGFSEIVGFEVGQDAAPGRSLERVEGDLDFGEVVAGLEPLPRNRCSSSRSGAGVAGGVSGA